jgi:hypothetical protein
MCLARNKLILSLFAVYTMACCSASLRALDITFTGGSFSKDDDVKLFDVVIRTTGIADFRSYGYGGGIASDGQAIAPGGFDSILTLFNSSGNLLTDNDDGAGAATDPSTSAASDARITRNLAVGSYILAITQYDNFALGSNLSDGFVESGNPAFTADPVFAPGPPCPSGLFRDATGTDGRCRTGSFTLDFLNVESVTPRIVPSVPEPLTAGLLAGGLTLVALGRKRRA